MSDTTDFTVAQGLLDAAEAQVDAYEGEDDTTTVETHLRFGRAAQAQNTRRLDLLDEATEAQDVEAAALHASHARAAATAGAIRGQLALDAASELSEAPAAFVVVATSLSPAVTFGAHTVVPASGPASGEWPTSLSDLESGFGGPLGSYTGPNPIYNTGVTVTKSGFSTGAMYGEGTTSGSNAGSTVRFSWARFAMTQGGSFRPKGSKCDWEVTDAIIEGDSDTVVSPIHGDLIHALLGSGTLTFRRCMIRWLHSGWINVQLTGMVNLEGWSGTTTFEDCALVHEGFGGYYPIRHGSGANIVFRRCQMPGSWDNRYPDGTQGTMVLVDCTDSDGDPIPDQTWVNRTRTFD